MHVSTAQQGQGQAGFTLIEVMVAMFLTAIMVMGIVGLWAMVDEQFLKLQYRQKAIFIANGEMARLSALGRYTDFFTVSSGFVDDGGGNRWIYRANPNFSGTPPTTLVVTKTANANITKAAVAENQILFTNTFPQANAATERNVVWLDRANNITALLEWDVTALPVICYGAGCYQIELRLSYPYRFQEGTDPAADELGATTTDTITIKTIVGQRLP